MEKRKNYIDNGRFEKLINLYIDDPRPHEDELMGLFDLLITNIMDSFKFNVSREDAKQDCFVLILKTLNNFSTDKGSAFNFFTTIIVNHLKLIYTKNKRYNEKISNYFDMKTGSYSSPSAV